MSKIDFVVTWVDENDPKWRSEKAIHEKNNDVNIDLNSEERYRDWEMFKYWFRAVEKHAPWVNRVFLITEGHTPEWLNLDNEKLVHVKHADFIDKAYLPTYNSNVIELNIQNIEELSENFVLFNDDTFLNKDVSPQEFFKQGVPRDIGVFSPIVPARNTVASTLLNNVEIINDYFDSRKILKKSFWKFFNIGNGKHIVKNFCVLPWSRVLGFYDHHLPVSYKKSYYVELYEKEKRMFLETYKNKFRRKNDISHLLVRYWQISLGDFLPRNVKFGKSYNLKGSNKDATLDIKMSKHSLICLNDNSDVTNFEMAKQELLQVFKEKYPDKSKFEV